MECAKAAAEIARLPECDPAQGGTPMIYLNIGEPDFTAPPAVQAAAEAAIRGGRTQYTDANGLPALREALSGWYRQRFGLDIAPERFVITAGASGALQLASLALFEPGDEVLMPDPATPATGTSWPPPGPPPSRCRPGRTSASSSMPAWWPSTGRPPPAACCWPRHPTPPAPPSPPTNWPPSCARCASAAA
jgi:hypothetical protein